MRHLLPWDEVPLLHLWVFGSSTSLFLRRQNLWWKFGWHLAENLLVHFGNFAMRWGSYFSNDFQNAQLWLQNISTEIWICRMNITSKIPPNFTAKILPKFPPNLTAEHFGRMGGWLGGILPEFRWNFWPMFRQNSTFKQRANFWKQNKTKILNTLGHFKFWIEYVSLCASTRSYTISGYLFIGKLLL